MQFLLYVPLQTTVKEQAGSSSKQARYYQKQTYLELSQSSVFSVEKGNKKCALDVCGGLKVPPSINFAGPTQLEANEA